MSPTAKKPTQGTEPVAPPTGELFMHLLRRHRIAVGLTQTALARALGTTPSTVSMWESGHSIPSPKRVPKLARILRLDAMSLTRVIAPETSTAAATA